MTAPTLVEATPEGRILAALVDGPKRFIDLRRKTHLSERWLSKKLGELLAAGLIERSGDAYCVHDIRRLLDLDPLFRDYLRRVPALRSKARLIGQELSRVEGIVAIVLFGSVAKGAESEDSDADLLLVTKEGVDSKAIDDLVYELMLSYDVPLESVQLTYEEAMVNLHEMTAFAFGVLEGYVVLHDVCGLSYLLSERRKQLMDQWVYDEEAGAWIQKNLLHISRPQRSS